MHELDAAGWLRELQRCAHLASEAEKREAGEPTFEEERESIFHGQIPDGFIPSYIGPTIVQAVDEVAPESLGALKKHMLILQVWLPAADADIMAAVEEELRRARKRYPSQIKKPGPQALTGTIGQTEFHRWTRHKIVEISELFDWGSREGRALSNADLGRWLFSDRKDPDKYACKAKEVRQRAFDLIPALSAHTLRPSKSKRAKRSR